MNFTTLLKFGEHITKDSPVGDRVSIGLQVVGIGMGVVFGVLLILIGILQVFKLLSKKPDSVKNIAKVDTPVASSTPVATVSASEEEKIVAIATAAIAAARGKSDVDFNVISITPIGCAPAVTPSASAPAAAPAPASAPVAEVKSAAPVSSAASADGEKVNAPLPGNVLDVKVSKGVSVKKGDILCILEAMKMENEIVAPVDGTVVDVKATKGASVNTGDLLFVIG